MAATKNRNAPKKNKAPSPRAANAGRKQRERPKEGGKLSAVAAAARVLEESGQPMTCPEMIEAMATKGYWQSLNGKTPAATLYSALAREVKQRGKQARFKKAGPGKFARA